MNGVFGGPTVTRTFNINGIIITKDIPASENLALGWRNTTYAKLAIITGEPIMDLSKALAEKMKEQYQKHYARQDEQFAASLAQVYHGPVPDSIASTSYLLELSQKIILNAFRNMEYALSPFYWRVGPAPMERVLARLEGELKEAFERFANDARKLEKEVRES